MRIQAWLALALLIVSSFTTTPGLAKANCGECPEKFCTDPAYAKKLKAEKKRAAESRGLPPRLSAMFDQLGDCEACVRTAPDWPHITWTIDRKEYKAKFGEDSGYDRISRPWSADTEMRLRNELKDGLVKAFHIYLGADTCKCCPSGADMETYTHWKAGEDVPTESRDSWNKDKDFDDNSPQHNYTDKDKLGEDPKDLTEVSERNRRPNQLQDPGVEEYPAERRVHVVCRECKDLEKEYNDLAEELDDMRRDLGQAKRNVSLMAQAMDFVWNDMYHNENLAQTAATRKKQDELMHELGTRQSDYNKAREKYNVLKKKWDEGHAKLKELMAKILECEKDKCKKPVEEKKDAVGTSGGGKVEHKPAEDKAAEIGTTSGSSSASSGAAVSARSEIDVMLDKDTVAINSKASWAELDTLSTCPLCERELAAYRATLREILHTYSHIRGLEYERDYWQEAIQQGTKDGRVTTDGGVDAAGGYAKNLADKEDTYNPIIAEYKTLLKQLQQQAQEQAAALKECEKKCQGSDSSSGSSGVVGGSGGGVSGGGSDEGITGFEMRDREDAISVLPNWNGRYETNCHPCKKLATELNTTGYRATSTMYNINAIKQQIAILSGLLERGNEKAVREYIDKVWENNYSRHPSAPPRPRTNNELKNHLQQLHAELSTEQGNLSRIIAHFNTVLAMYEDCLKKYCGGDTANGTAVRVGSDADIVIETANTVSGTNPHNAKDVEQAGVNGHGRVATSSASSGVVVTPPSSSGVVSSSSGTTSSSSGSSSASSSGTTPPPEPEDPPLDVNTSGSFSFSHTVGSSPCPQAAGTVQVSSNNGNPLTVTGVSVSGTISTRLTVSVSGSGTATPSITAQFNCSSAQNGSFSGNVTATVTDSVTGETEQISIPASGSVSG